MPAQLAHMMPVPTVKLWVNMLSVRSLRFVAGTPRETLAPMCKWLGALKLMRTNEQQTEAGLGFENADKRTTNGGWIKPKGPKQCRNAESQFG